MQPTFKQVPPRAPRFSIHDTYDGRTVLALLALEHSSEVEHGRFYLEAFLSGLDGRNVSGNAASDYTYVLLLYKEAQ